MSEKLSEERIRSIRAVLFDKDGTLIDFDRTWFSISWQLAQRAAKGMNCGPAHCSTLGAMTG